VSRAVSITLDSIVKHYSTQAGVVRALDGVTIDVPAGTSLAVTGPSGCGKSTLLGVIGGLEPPTSGRALVGGRDLADMPARARARLRRELFGLVFQSDNLLPFLTAIENVSLQLALQRASGGNEQGDRDRDVGLLTDLGLAAEMEKLPDQLSGGQRQRVAVARALVHRPGLILADEPTGELDAENSGAVLDLLVGAQRETGATLVMVTHDPVAAGRLDRTVSLRDGRLA
jgi:putative ABC transport system ATP-binding protein